jgi:hypothetical protein
VFLNQLDDLTASKVIVLKWVDYNQFPRILHFRTAANDRSDYILGSRLALKGMMVQETRKIAQDFIGETTNDGLLLAALTTKLEARYAELKKLGYISYANATVSTTPSEQRLGHAGSVPGPVKNLIDRSSVDQVRASCRAACQLPELLPSCLPVQPAISKPAMTYADPAPGSS